MATANQDIQIMIVERIQQIAPNLTKKDVNDLMKLEEKQLGSILEDYMTAGKLNKPTLTSLLKFLKSLTKYADLAKKIAAVAK